MGNAMTVTRMPAFALAALLAFGAPLTAAAGDAAAGPQGRTAAILAGAEFGDDLMADGFSYPSPEAVLALAAELQLDASQRAAVTRIRDAMFSDMKEIAPDYIRAEDDLADLFRSGRANPAMIKRLTEKSATLRGQLRAIHLSARSKMRTQLTTEQLRAYALYRSGEG